MSKWISVDEQYPDVDVFVLGFDSSLNECEVVKHNGDYWTKKAWPISGITHWMPLPEPPTQ